MRAQPPARDLKRLHRAGLDVANQVRNIFGDDVNQNHLCREREHFSHFAVILHGGYPTAFDVGLLARDWAERKLDDPQTPLLVRSERTRKPLCQVQANSRTPNEIGKSLRRGNENGTQNRDQEDAAGNHTGPPA